MRHPSIDSFSYNSNYNLIKIIKLLLNYNYNLFLQYFNIGNRARYNCILNTNGSIFTRNVRFGRTARNEHRLILLLASYSICHFEKLPSKDQYKNILFTRKFKHSKNGITFDAYYLRIRLERVKGIIIPTQSPSNLRSSERLREKKIWAPSSSGWPINNSSSEEGLLTRRRFIKIASRFLCLRPRYAVRNDIRMCIRERKYRRAVASTMNRTEV